jgi:hypothetical protein
LTSRINETVVKPPVKNNLSANQAKIEKIAKIKTN